MGKKEFRFDLNAVSYTHLDVYKRQVKDLKLVHQRLGVLKNLGLGYLTPVSYTHLDVYKRQVLLRS